MPPSQTTESATTQMLSTTESIEYEDYYDLEPWQINVLTNIKEPAGQQCMLDFWNAPKPKSKYPHTGIVKKYSCMFNTSYLIPITK